VVLSQRSVFAARRAILDLYMAPEVEDYLVHLVMATRKPEAYSPICAAGCASARARAQPSRSIAARARSPG
jgi:hypothetical protein